MNSVMKEVTLFEFDGKLFPTKAEVNAYIDEKNAKRAETVIYELAIELVTYAGLSPTVRRTMLATIIDPLAEACEQLERATRSARATRE